MRFVINVVQTDSDEKVVDRKTVGEYKTEIEAVRRVMEEDQKLRKSNEKGVHVEMLQIMEK